MKKKCAVVSFAALGLALVAVPALFAEPAYIQGYGSEYFNLGLCARPELKAQLHFTYTGTSYSPQQCIFGTDFGGGASKVNQISFSTYQNGAGCYAFTAHDGEGLWRIFNNNGGYSKVVAGEERILTIDMPNNKGTLTDPAGTFTYTTTAAGSRTQTNSVPMYLFHANRPGRESSSMPALAKMWSFKLWDKGELIRYIVPYGDGTKVGMRDVLTGEIYWNQGSGAFTAGGAVGVCADYKAEELAGKTLASGYKVVDGMLVDFSVPGWRENGGKLEYRVMASTTDKNTVTLDGTSGTTVEKWFAYGTTNTLALASTAKKSDCSFSRWSGDTATLSSGFPTDAAVTLKVVGPTALTALVRATDDVFSDATVWMRGPSDLNGDGLLQSGEQVSAIGERKPYTGMSVYNGAVISNEWVAMPFRGGKRLMPTLYLPQRVEITNATLNTGKMWVSTANLNSFTPKAGITDDNFSFIIRFRPDLTQVRNDYAWIFNWGYNNKASGFNLGINKADRKTINLGNTKVTNNVEYTEYNLSFFKQGQNANVLDFGNGNGSKYVYGGLWHDLAVAVDKKNMKLRAVLSRAWWDADLIPGIIPEYCSDKGGQNLWTREVNITSSDLVFKPTANILIGSEGSANGVSVYTNNGYVAGNATKAFRGSIQQFAVWNRALSFDEMKAAIAGPRPDIMRVGVRDGKGDELRGGDGTEQDDREWTVAASLKTGESATVKFVADKMGEDEANQVLRVFLADDSAAGTLRATLNGYDLGARTASAGDKAEWKVRKGKLLPVTSTLWGSTNTLVITRTDAGAGAVALDALALGGTMQVGQKNSSYMEFAHEGSGKQTHEVLNANTYDVKRVYFGAIPSEAGSYPNTNMLFTFTMPQEFKGGNYRWRLGWKDHTGDTRHLPRWRLNGVDLGYSAKPDSKYHTLDVTSGILPDGVNTLELYNNAPYVKGAYYSIDYWRLEIVPLNGAFLILR